MKPLDGTFAENAEKHGVAGLNIDGGRVGVDTKIDDSQLRTMNRSQRAEDNGWGMNQKAEDKPHVLQPEGRWPSNLIHDGSEEVIEKFPDAPGQIARARTDGELQGNNTYGSLKHVTSNPNPRAELSKSAARFFYCAKASRKERNVGCENLQKKPLNWSSGDENPGAFQGEGTDRTSGNNHPTVKSLELMRYLARITKTPTGGIVLDPFAGSGTTGMACKIEGRDFIGFEKEENYVEIANLRIKHAFEALETEPGRKKIKDAPGQKSLFEDGF
jgi:site-specific DNA-methyltransferase (adenine-specific)